MSLDKLSRLVDQQRKTQDEIDNEIILAVKEVLATNSVDWPVSLLGVSRKIIHSIRFYSL
ncbi:hypothetical protein ACW7C8_13150 [Klebsiella pneumoniae]|uniref:hypothetical protein n=1 Tax=Gammaproteobacteria TaxID=1236 RepID=UPI001D0DC67E|nr:MULTISPECIES: hypothetical protein [Gammaproteobacteria]MCD8654974.1 hypothetical protein [Klebsiella pneumoniae]MCK0942207.1 hypothetical protein [Klebsiella pneumoniae]MCK0952119.1 hypothetical protein [Enterobacter hormaechei subsp. steigerwaltii]MCM8727575.1 hypothetical protein [Enterobacter hormaechei]MCO6035227.1 hypothetical protein [Enterobacter hormaechei]